MTTVREGETLTRVGPGTPMGELMRQYWLPAAKSGELAVDGEPMRLMLLGEKFVAFRDTNGKVGVMDHRCPHRCASLFFGRNEEGGIRCVYHGWKFDADGNCLDMANVPPHQDFKHKVHAKSYKTAERSGVVWVFMGDQANIPNLPDIEATLVPDDDAVSVFVQRECNYLQGLEGSIDTSHAGFLHGTLKPEENFGDGDLERLAMIRRDPEYVMTETDCGTAYGAYRPAEAAGETYWRVAHYLFPFWTLSPTGPLEGHVAARAWVPMDDTHTMSVWFGRKKRHRPKVRALGGGIAEFDAFLPNTTDWYGRWRTAANATNDYLIDREDQRTKTYSGIEGVLLQDQMITEAMGAITDFDHEHLAPSDQMITLTRRRLLTAAQALAKDGTRPPAADTPALYALARSGFFVEAEGRDWLEAYTERVEAARISTEGLQAAE